MELKARTLRTISILIISVSFSGYILLSLCKGDLNKNIRNVFIPPHFDKQDSVANLSKQLGDKNLSTGYMLSGTEIKHCFHLSYKLQSLETLKRMNIDTVKEVGQSMSKGKDKETKRDLKQCRQFVTIGYYVGRMGNQMFQIASLIGLAHTYDAIPLIPISSSLNKYFDLPNKFDSKKSKITNVVNCVAGNSAMFYNCSKVFSSQANITVHGYLQSWKYFADASDIIREVFKLKSKYLNNAKSFLSKISTAGHQRVCIHARRGDLLIKRMVDKGHVTASLDYIEKAKEFFVRKYKKVQFIVVSDDKPWCRKNIKNAVISTLTDPGDDMALLVLSDHVITTVGTFGWWGAWLSRGTTVYLNEFVRPGSALASRINREDYIPSNWIGI